MQSGPGTARDILAGTGACVPRGQTVARDSSAQEGALGMRSESGLPEQSCGVLCLGFLPPPQLLPSLLPFWPLLIRIPPSLPRVS